MNGLRGTIPTDVGALTGLSLLGLPRNNLTGTIPASLKNLRKLKSLGLIDNRVGESAHTRTH